MSTALPTAWPEGRVTGLRARGGFTVDLTWNAGELVVAQIRAQSDGRVTVRYAGRLREVAVQNGAAVEFKP